MTPTTPMALLAGATSIDLLAGQSDYQGVQGSALNNSGQSTGQGLLASVSDWRPYRWTPGTGFETLTPFWPFAQGMDINDAGVVVGTAVLGLQSERGFVAAGTTMTPLSTLDGAHQDNSQAVAINNAGQIVGVSAAPSPGEYHAVLWSPSLEILDLGTLGGRESAAIDINASGQVIGYGNTDDPSPYLHSFLWSSGSGMQDLNTTIDPNIISVSEINDAGQITGTIAAPNGQTHAFLYTPGSGLRDLGTLGGDYSIPTGLNNKGQVVGNSRTAAGIWHAFLWTPEDGLEDITTIAGLGYDQVHRLNDHLQTLSYSKLVTLEVQHVPATWPFSGFEHPIHDPPAWNTATAGQTIVLRFGLGGNRGLSIFAMGSPSTVEVSCATGATIGAATPIPATDIVLQYQRHADRYMLRWKTSRTWSASCRQLTFELVDGSSHAARFTFR